MTERSARTAESQAELSIDPETSRESRFSTSPIHIQGPTDKLVEIAAAVSFTNNAESDPTIRRRHYDFLEQLIAGKIDPAATSVPNPNLPPVPKNPD